MKKQVLVIGLGRFGSSVVRSLYNTGNDVLAIDIEGSRVANIMTQATHALTADATNETVLKDLGVQDYDAAIVAIGSNIVPSIMASVLLKTMGVPYIVARASNELHGNTLERIGVDKIIHAENEMGVRLGHNLFNPNVQEYLEVTPSYGISKMKIPTNFIDKTLKELGFSNPRDKYGLAVIAIRRSDTDITLNTDINDRLQAGDWLIFAGKDELIDQIEIAEWLN